MLCGYQSGRSGECATPLGRVEARFPSARLLRAVRSARRRLAMLHVATVAIR